MDGSVGNDAFVLIVIVAAGVEVAVEAREVAARDFHPDLMAGGEIIARCHRLQRDLVYLTVLHPDRRTLVTLAVAQALDGFIEVVGGTIGRDVDKFYRHVRILNVSGDVERDLDRATDLRSLLQGHTGIDKDV